MSVELVDENGGLPMLHVRNRAATAHLSLTGAHLVSFIPAGHEEAFWTCPNQQGIVDMTLHGGIPLCWPWFGKPAQRPDLPEHGFARTEQWKLQKTEDLDDHTTQVTLVLSDTPETHRLWDFRFRLQAVFTITDTLTVQLITTNLDDRPFTITQGLHTFFKVGQISQARLLGFEHLTYFNKVDGSDGNAMPGRSFVIDREIDRIYHGAPGPFIIRDSSLGRTFKIIPDNSDTAVIWNPWRDCHHIIPGYEPDDYQTMVCVETCNALEDAQTVQPGQSRALQATYMLVRP